MKIWILSAGHLIFIAFSALGDDVPDSLIEGLSSESFKEREGSQTKLLSWAETGGKEGASSIYRLSQKKEDPEVSRRCLEVLKSLSDRDYLSDGQGYLGIKMLKEMVGLPGEEKPRACIRVVLVVADGPADTSGLLVGDLITGLNGKKLHAVEAADQFTLEIADSKPLEAVALTIKRKNGDLREVEVILGKRPVENLNGINQDLKLLDQRVRQEHFEQWLKSLAAEK